MTDNYKFKYEDFNQMAENRSDIKLFSEFIVKCEHEFHQTYQPLVANYLFASPSTLLFLERDFFLDENEKFGMDLIDNMVNLEANLQMENYSRFSTIYALGSSIKSHKNESLYLISDDSVPDLQIVLRYLPESGDEFEPDTVETPDHVNVSVN